jgi:hypothetical protein
MPEELLYHPEVMELREAIKGLQADFVDTHKALDAAQQEVKCVATSCLCFVSWCICSMQLTDKQRAGMSASTACLQDPAGFGGLSSTQL